MGRASARAAAGALAAVLALPGVAAPHRAEHRPVAARPVMDYVPPPAGSYALPVIQQGPDGRVLGPDGQPTRLAVYTRGRVTLLSLIYTYCVDPIGCPLAYETAVDLRRRLLEAPALHGRVRLVSLSFDPINDTPAAMRAYGGEHARAGGPVPWTFLTARSLGELRPILDGLGHDIEVERDARGRPTRTISHMLKLFLLDRHGRVREIYSTAYLHPATMLNDIRTLVMEDDARR